MSQSLTILLTHLVFSTKDRRPWLDVPVQPRLFAYQAAALSAQDCVPILVNGMPDHVHMLFGLSKNKALAEIVREVKAASSKWLKQQDEQYSCFAWQRGYAAFSVSLSQRDQVERYVQAQQQHHQKISYQDELRALLRKHGVEFDERYLWD